MGRQSSAVRVEVVRFEPQPKLTERPPEVSTPAPSMSHELHTLQMQVDFDAPPDAVFEALMDESQHAAFTGHEAMIDWREGGRFSTLGEQQFGHTLVLVPERKIVQAWSHRSLPTHHFTIVTFELEPYGDGTRLTLTQQGIPEDACGWVEEGWAKYYWEPLRKYLEDGEAGA